MVLDLNNLMHFMLAINTNMLALDHTYAEALEDELEAKDVDRLIQVKVEVEYLLTMLDAAIQFKN
jgi:hypothetical protein